jgi:predicted ATPase
MAKKESQVKPNSAPAEKGITKITVAGYKSISQEQSIEIRPLTILAGANSSGKSSMMQPLLLLKQTLEASYDPGALLLDGPNVKFTSTDQLLSRIGNTRHAAAFQVSVGIGSTISLSTTFKKVLGKGFEVESTTYSVEKEKLTFYPNMSTQQIRLLSPRLKKLLKKNEFYGDLSVVRNRCFLNPLLRFGFGKEDNSDSFINSVLLNLSLVMVLPDLELLLEPIFTQIIHVPGLRGIPERTYPMTASGKTFPGTFENYTASVIAQWQTSLDADNLENLSQELNELGLTWKVMAEQVSDTQVELKVARLPKPSKASKRDMVSIADVGVGVSQTLPVLVALHAAKPGQLVYIEQPEIHLHPRAQTAMAHILANAAKRGVRVVVETHSSLLILGIQTLVAEGAISPELIKLHWFERRNGHTEITSRDLDETGAFGDWPEDFADVTLEAQSRYLDAAESRMRSKRRAS